MMAINQPFWDYALISFLKKYDLKSCEHGTKFMVNQEMMVLWHPNLIITFSMHSVSMSQSFISIIGCRSIVSQNLYSLDYGVEPSTCFKERFIKSRSSMEVTSLQKLGQKMDRVTSFLCLLPTHNCFNLQKLRTVDVHVLFLDNM